jgi:hypothetical protein
MAVSEQTKWKLLKYLVVRQVEWKKPSDIRRDIGNAVKQLQISEAELTELVQTIIRENAEDKIQGIQPRLVKSENIK